MTEQSKWHFTDGRNLRKCIW